MAHELKVQLFPSIVSSDRVDHGPLTTLIPVSGSPVICYSSAKVADEQETTKIIMHHPHAAADRDVDRQDCHLNLDTTNGTAADGDRGPQAMKRKRGRPRKIKGEGGEQETVEQSGDELPPKRSRGRPKKTDQVGVKRSVDNSGAVQPAGKRGRGRPKKINTQIEEEEEGKTCAMTFGADGCRGLLDMRHVGVTTAHASTDIYNVAVAQDSATVSAIRGTQVQVLPTATAVTTMNLIDSSPLRPAPVSVVVSPSADDAGEWTARTPPSSSSMIGEGISEKKAAETSLMSRLQSSPPLLHAEQPKVLNLLPQCVVTNSVISVNLVDRFAQQDDEETGDNVVAERVCSQKDKKEEQPQEQSSNGEQRKGTEKEEQRRVTAERNSNNEVAREHSKRRKGQPSRKPEAPRPQPPNEDTPVKRKRGRPPKNSTSLTQKSDASPSPLRKERPGRDSVKEQAETADIKATTPGAEETVAKRKRGRPPKNKNPNPPTESTPLPARQRNQPEANSSTVSNGDLTSTSPAKRGRPSKSSKLKGQATEAKTETPIKRKRGRPRKYPIPVVAASGPFLPSVSGIALPVDGQSDEETTCEGSAPLSQDKGKQQEDKNNSVSTTPVKRKRGRPPKTPDGPPVKRRPGRPRKTSLPVEEEESSEPQQQLQVEEEEGGKEEQKQQQPRRKPGRPRKQATKASPEAAQASVTSPVVEPQTTDTLPKRKRGRPRKIQPVVTTLEEPGLSLSSSADESTLSLSASAPERGEDDSTEKLTLQISFSDSDSEHSEKLEVQTSTIMALANRVVPPTPSPPRRLDSPLSFQESYDEDSDPETK